MSSGITVATSDGNNRSTQSNSNPQLGDKTSCKILLKLVLLGGFVTYLHAQLNLIWQYRIGKPERVFLPSAYEPLPEQSLTHICAAYLWQKDGLEMWFTGKRILVNLLC